MLFAAVAVTAIALSLGLPAAASATAAFAKTYAVGVTGSTTATVLGIINPENEPTTYELQYDLASSAWCTSGGTSGSASYTAGRTDLSPSWFPSYVSVDVTGLTYEEKYCGEFVATNPDGEGDGGQMAWVESTPDVVTSDAYAATFNTGVVEGQINPHQGSTVYMAEYDTSNSGWCTSDGATGTPSNSMDWHSLGFSDDAYHDVSVELDQLTPGGTYCARLIAYSGGTSHGAMVTFTDNKPGATTGSATATGVTTAVVTGSVIASGLTTTYDVQYDLAGSDWCSSDGASGAPANTTAPVTLGFTDASDHNVSVNLTGLTTSARYCARLTATNASGEANGTQLTWTEGVLPEALTYGTVSTSTTEAEVAGEVNGHAEDTTYVVQYDLASSDWCTRGAGSAADSAAGTGAVTGDDLVLVGLTGLVAGTDYCAQIVATDANGQSAGGQVWWTQGAPTADTNTVDPSGTTAAIAGDVDPAGTATTYQIDYDYYDSNWCQTGLGSAAHSTSPEPLGATDGNYFYDVSGDLTGLTPGDDYCADVVATNAYGTYESYPVYWEQPAAPPPPPPPVSMTVGVVGNGKITSSPAGIDCGDGASACTHSFASGTTVTLTATPTSGSTFTGWSGSGCSGTGACVVTLSSSTSAQAVFTAPTTTPPPPPPPPKSTACVVPKVSGKTLAAAKKAIRNAHCSVGKITKAKSKKRNRGRVISESPRPGKHLSSGGKVALRLGK